MARTGEYAPRFAFLPQRGVVLPTVCGDRSLCRVGIDTSVERGLSALTLGSAVVVKETSPMTAIVIIAFAAHIAAWIVLPASKSRSTKSTAVVGAVPHTSPAVQLSGA